MTIKPGARDLLWAAVGAAILLVFTAVVIYFYDEGDVAERLALKVRKIDLVRRMQTGLASAAEAEKSAVLATTDDESRAFADRARALSAGVEQARQELSTVLKVDGTPDERDRLAQFSQAFVELQRIDAEVLSLAVKNTNLKAYALAYGPAAEALSDMGAALARLGRESGEATAERPQATAERPQASTSTGSSESTKVALLANAAEIAALRFQILLPPHIAAERDDEMDEMEARMANEEQAVRTNLDGLAVLPSLAGNADLATATSKWHQVTDIKTQILALSRENTNVRSLDMSLNRKRRVLLMNEDALAAMERAVEEEHVGSTSAGRWVLPR